MKVFVAGFQHETNTFAGCPTIWTDFEAGDFFPAFSAGLAMLDRLRSGGMPLSGFIERAEAEGIELVPSCWAGASPSASIADDAISRISDRLLGDLDATLRAGDLSGIYLDLHGAAVSDSHDSPEAWLVTEIREWVGPDLPIVVSLDLHANVDKALLDAADYVVCYRTYPHIDMTGTGARAFELLSRRLNGAPRLACSHVRIPFLIPVISQSTRDGPGTETYALATDLDARQQVDINVALGFPAADVANCGPVVWAYGPGGAPAARAVADRIIDLRDKWRLDILDAADAVARALVLAESANGPIVIADVQDNPGAGSDSNTTGLLHALLDAGTGKRWPGRVVLGLLNDPAAAKIATEAGIGSTLELSMGTAVQTWTGSTSEPPVTRRAIVRALHHGPVRLDGPMMRWATMDPGVMACVEVDGVLVCLSSAKTQMLDRGLYAALRLDCAAMKIIVNKSAVHSRADFAPIASHILVARAAGQMAADPADFPWTKLQADALCRC